MITVAEDLERHISMSLAITWSNFVSSSRLSFFFNLFRFCKIGLINTLFIFGRKLSFVFCLVCCNTLHDFGSLFLNCSSRRAEKDFVMYPNSTMDRFRPTGISRFQF